MTISTHRRMTLQEYLNYDDGTDTRYELVNGVLVKMGAESALNISIAFFLAMTFAQLGIPPYRIGNKHLIEVSSSAVTAREPDLTVHSEASYEAVISEKQSLLRYDKPVPLLVVEVVSPGEPGEPNYDRDYVEKRREYAQRGIPEYWLIDPLRQLVLVLTLEGDSYREQRFTEQEAISSPTFPQLNLTAERVLNAGR
ncbi:Uma2 family endonuclease [Oscillatoriales cyanobacterium LEGE 11467]|uniref:Uma2 family endonuclease n=1 Tax=Zarconia navalis LEGE 11467 TaxID=1828826 RepID=A0A928VYC1_9CYAN|nr:Uma2 family endonuclease [Zarconia navalis]MBE9042447.1 Uma2 family endonuclease [Zarconia navalis LEGE 11467]